MSNAKFDVVTWKRETYRKLLHPGGYLPRFEYKPPPMIYGTAQDGDAEIEAEPVAEIDGDE
jgi:hypothetical protein